MTRRAALATRRFIQQRAGYFPVALMVVIRATGLPPRPGGTSM
jgi:hypothetical protein